MVGWLLCVKFVVATLVQLMGTKYEDGSKGTTDYLSTYYLLVLAYNKYAIRFDSIQAFKREKYAVRKTQTK